MENKNKKSKALIITIIAIVALFVALFLIYKNRDIFGVKTSASIAKIFSPLTASENQKKSTIQANENIKKGDGVTSSGNKATDNDSVWGYANEDIDYGNTGEITLVDNGNSSFWNSVSGFLNGTFGFDFKGRDGGSNGLAVCSDKVDNDKDGLTDTLDPNCHIGGDLEKAYVPSHHSEDTSPVDTGPLFEDVCSDKIDNDEDGKIDNLDPNCHIDGDLAKAYVPSHHSEDYSHLNDSMSVDLTARNVYPSNSIVNAVVSLTSTIVNNGRVGTEKSFFSFFTITNDKNKAQTSVTEDKEESVIVPTLESGARSAISINHTFTKAGVYYIRACADKKSGADTGTIIELSEDNNCGDWTTFTVTNSLPIEGYKAECSDEKDNDKDGLIDRLDPNCHLDGDLAKAYVPDHDTEDTSPVDPLNGKSECSDKVDNDKDGNIDVDDPNCHLDGDLSKEYLKEHDSESTSPYSNEDKCLDIEQNPLTFTDHEKATLSDLLRKFYLLAPNLRSEEDIAMIYNEITKYENLSDELDSLTKACYAQTNDPSYAGPKTKYGNPWFNYDSRGTYLDKDNYSNSYCWNDKTKSNPHNFDRNKCSGFTTQATCERYNGNNLFGSVEFLATGCTWVEGSNLKEYEALLNIW